MSKVSVIIPAWGELYLQRTIDNLLENLTGDYEIIVTLDGYWPDPPLRDHPKLTLLHRERRGMRQALNAAASVASGDYLLKIDGHCAVAYGFNEVLSAECEDNWIVIPRRYSLEEEDWTPRRYKKFIDYEYLGHPSRKQGRMHGERWHERTLARIDRLVDEAMTFQGSCWLMKRDHFWNTIGGFSDEGYGTFVCEAQEIGLKTWLGGGKNIINKKTWYAHLWKGKGYRDKFNELFKEKYTRVGHNEYVNGNRFNTDFWMNNRWPDRIHDFAWLVERFWPVPTWPEDRDKWTWFAE